MNNIGLMNIHVFNNILFDYRALIFNLPYKTNLSSASLVKPTLLPRHRLQNQSQSEMHPFDATRMLSEVAGRVIGIPKQTREREREREKASIHRNRFRVILLIVDSFSRQIRDTAYTCTFSSTY